MDALMLEQAREILLNNVKKIEEVETVSLWDVDRRVLARDVKAEYAQPPFPRSPLDGYAVKSEDIQGASKESPVCLKVIEEVDAGHVCTKMVKTGTAVRIMTGAPIPDGADCIVGQEDTDYGEQTVEVYESISSYENYCFVGEDYPAGATLLKEGMILGAAEAGTMASAGLTEAVVYRRPKVALITTGDEVLLPGEERIEGKIYDSNLYSLGVKLVSWGVNLTFKKRVGDDVDKAAVMIESAAEEADIIITTGGVSVGKKDIMHDVLDRLNCQRLFWRIAIKPGMPTLCAMYKGKLLICLSGNPYGAIANLELLVRPLLAKMMGRNDLEIKKEQAICDNAFPKRSGVTRYIRARYDDGHVRIADGKNDSGILSNLCGCNCMIEVPAGTKSVELGDLVTVVLI